MYQAKRIALQMLYRATKCHVFSLLPHRQTDNTDTTHTHTAVSQSCTHTAVSRSRTHTAGSRSRTHTAVSQSCTHKATRQSRTHTAVSRQLHNLHNLAISSSSSRAYKSGLRRFRLFCKQLKLTALPASKHTVALFAAELSRSVAPRTARVYLAAAPGSTLPGFLRGSER